MYFCGDLHHGGTQRYLAELIPVLDHERFEPVIVCSVRRGMHASLYESIGVRVEQVRVFWRKGVPSLIGCVKAVRLLRREMPELVHCLLWLDTILVPVLARLAGVQKIVSSMRNMGFWLDNWLKRVCFRFVNRRVVDVMLTNSESAKAWLVTNSLCPEDKIAVVKNGISLEALRSSQSPDSIKAELGVGEEPVVGTVAKLRAVKGVRYFVEAAAMIHARHPSAKFLVVGDGPEREKLHSLASRLGLNGHIIFAGARDDARDLLGLLDVFVLPSLSEGMPWAVLEAMAVGLPVVATRVGGVPELVDDGRTGYLVEPRDAESISDNACKLIDDPHAMKRLGSAGRKRAETDFALDKMRRDTEELYVRLMEARDIVR